MRSTTTVALLLAASLGGAIPLAAQDPVPESEPNDTPAEADTAVLGGRIKGAYDPKEDQDFWVLHANAGDTIYADVDAQETEPFSTMLVFIELLGGDGVTHLAYGRSWDVLDPYLVYVAPTTGWYYLLVRGSLYTGSGPSARYTINFRSTQCPLVEADHEPNDSRATASPLALNSSITSLSCPMGDVDFYKLSVTTPTTVAVELRTPPQRQPHFGDAVDLSAGMYAYSADGTQLASRGIELHTGPDSARLEFDAVVGTYYVSVHLFPAGYRYTYTLSARSEVGTGPGDPVTTVASNLGLSRALAVSATGDMYVASDDYRILRVTPSGTATELTRDRYMNDLTLDRFGNLLGAGTRTGTCCVAGEGVVYRFAPNGQATPLIEDLSFPLAIAVAPNGSIWVSDVETRTLRHYNPAGHLIAAYDVSQLNGGYINDIAFSPDSVLHFSTEEGVYRFTGNQPHLVVAQHRVISGFTFDANGSIYIANLGALRDDGFGGSARIDRYDANGAPLALPFAGTPKWPQGVAFGRNSDGSPNRRLFFIEIDGALAEVKAGSPDAPGGEPLPHAVTVTRASRGIFHPDSLSADERAELDAQGNQNGRYDIGDLRILLTRMGVVAAPSKRVSP